MASSSLGGVESIWTPAIIFRVSTISVTSIISGRSSSISRSIEANLIKKTNHEHKTNKHAVSEKKWNCRLHPGVSTISVLMMLTLLGNVSLIVIIASRAELRHKRVSVFLLNLAVGDLMVCFVTMTTEILFVAFGQWVLGAVACKLIVYGQIVTLA